MISVRIMVIRVRIAVIRVRIIVMRLLAIAIRVGSGRHAHACWCMACRACCMLLYTPCIMPAARIMPLVVCYMSPVHVARNMSRVASCRAQPSRPAGLRTSASPRAAPSPPSHIVSAMRLAAASVARASSLSTGAPAAHAKGAPSAHLSLVVCARVCARARAGKRDSVWEM